MAQRVHGVIIDPNNDFMDEAVPGVPTPALAVPGASEGARCAGAMIDRLGDRVDDWTVTLDSHHLVDVGHPTMWVAADGKTPPPPFTAITSDDIRAGIWTPRFANAQPPELDGLTVREYMIRYASQLEAQGKHLLMVWTVHCLIGSPGYAVQPDLFAALNRWASQNFANIDWVTKGTNPWTEHYGALQAEVPMPTDPSTQLNARLLETLKYADIVPILGWARTHCLRESITQIADNVDEKLVRKLWLITDCTSDIPAVPGGPNFPAMADAWQKEMVDRGMHLTTSTEFLAA